MIYYIFVYTGYEADGIPYRFGCEDGIFHRYQEFMLKRDALMTDGHLIHMDKKTKPGYENIVHSILGKIRSEHIHPPPWGIEGDYDGSNNAIFRVNDNSESTIDRIIQDCRDLDYCHIWDTDPIESIESYLLSEDEEEKSALLYLWLEAESE